MKVPYGTAMNIAEKVIEYLNKFCSRVEIVGSLRRKCNDVKDIDILCIPKIKDNPDLFGEPTIEYLTDNMKLSKFGTVAMNGPKLKRIKKHTVFGDIQIEINIVTPPAEWGVLCAIRTGPGLLSKMMVTSNRYTDGYLMDGYYVKDGALWDPENNKIPTPEEKDFFRYLSLPSKFNDPVLRNDYKNMIIKSKLEV